jgi:hypothetical protein
MDKLQYRKSCYWACQPTELQDQRIGNFDGRNPDLGIFWHLTGTRLDVSHRLRPGFVASFAVLR